MTFGHKFTLPFILVAVWLGTILLSGCQAATPTVTPPSGAQETPDSPIANSETACAQPTTENRFAPIEGNNKIAFSAERLSFYDVDADQVLSIPELRFAEHTTNWGFVWGPDAEALVFVNGRA